MNCCVNSGLRYKNKKTKPEHKTVNPSIRSIFPLDFCTKINPKSKKKTIKEINKIKSDGIVEVEWQLFKNSSCVIIVIFPISTIF